MELTAMICLSDHQTIALRYAIPSAQSSLCILQLRACLHGVWGPQVDELTRLGGITCLSI